jgi:glycosyltransferase involved in cell wall biosynthesis
MMLNLARGLVDLGYPVDLVVGSAEGPYRDLVPEGCHLVDLRAGRVLVALPGLVRYLRCRRPAVLLSAMDHANLIALWARSLARVPTRVAVSVRNHLSQEAKHAPLLAGRWLPRLARVFYPQAQVVIAVSQGVADDLNRLIGPGRARVLAIPNPVVTPELAGLAAAVPDHAWWRAGSRPEDRSCGDVILAAGRLTTQKDFATLIRAFALLSRGRDLRLLILGEGPERATLESLISELGLTGRVDLPGFRANPFAYMARARLFVLSSAWEGLPGVLIQAMACGTPVVSTDCPSGPREVLVDGRYGPLVPVGDPEALAKAMAETLEHPSDAALLRARANDFGLEAVTGCYATAMGLDAAGAESIGESGTEVLRQASVEGVGYALRTLRAGLLPREDDHGH